MGLDRESELGCSAGLLQPTGEEELQWARLKGLLPRLQQTQTGLREGQLEILQAAISHILSLQARLASTAVLCRT